MTGVVSTIGVPLLVGGTLVGVGGVGVYKLVKRVTKKKEWWFSKLEYNGKNKYL